MNKFTEIATPEELEVAVAVITALTMAGTLHSLLGGNLDEFLEILADYGNDMLDKLETLEP